MMANDTEMSLNDFLRLIWRRKGLLVGITVLAVVIAAMVLSQIPARYTARVLVMIEGRESKAVNLEAVMVGLSGDAETVLSEIEVIRSRGLTEKLVDKLYLGLDPEFNMALRPPGLIGSLLDDAKTWLAGLFTTLGGPPWSPGEQPDVDVRTNVIDAVMSNIGVSRIRGSRVIAVEFTSIEPRVAARAANALTELYVVEHLEAKFDATRRATDWLNDRVTVLRETVKSSEGLVEQFRSQSGLLQGAGSTITSQQVTELNTQLILSRADRAEAEARLERLHELIELPNGINSVAEVLDSPVIQNLLSQEIDLRREIAELSTEFGERHPRMINIRAEAVALQTKVEIEVSKIVQGLRNGLEIALSRERTLEANLEGLKGDLGRANRAQVQLRALEREANADRLMLETFLTRFKETSEQQNPGIQQPDVRIISAAAVPQRPAWPKLPLIFTLVALVALICGVALVIALESLDRGFRSRSQVEPEIGVPALGLIPLVTGLGRRNRHPERYVLSRPRSAFSESLRSLYTSVLLTKVDQRPRSLLITSALPKEGKSTIVLALGRVQAASGSKVIVVDADMRRPKLHALLGLRREPGLLELLSGTATLDEVLCQDDATGLTVIPAGRLVPNPPDLLRSERMKALIGELAQRFELVVIDSPPVSVASDARIMTRICDATLLVVRWAETPREIVRQAVDDLRSAEAAICGVVLSMTDMRQYSRYSYGDAGYYYGSLKDYYSG